MISISSKNVRTCLRTALLLLLCLLTAASCGGQTAEPAETTAGATSSAESEAETVLPGPALPDKKYDGTKFSIYTRKRSANEYVITDLTGEVYNDAQCALITALEEQFGLTFEELISADDTYGTNAKTTVLAGDDAYQLLSGHARVMFDYPINHLALDWYSLPWIDLDNQWWDQNMLKDMSISGKIYLVPDDLTKAALASTKCYTINKEMFTASNVELPYAAVLDGTWTFDMMKELTSVFTNDLNGDGVMDIKTDQFGYTTSWWGAPINILWTAGQRIVSTDKDGRLQLVVNNQTTVDLYDKYLAFLAEPGAYCENMDGGPDTAAAFKEGRTAMNASSINSIVSLRDLDIDIGLVPAPKFFADQDRYYTGVDAGCNGLVVPISVADTEMVSAVIEYWMYLQYRDVLPVYYETVCKTKAARDEETALILDLIRDSRLYDIGYFHNGFPMNSIGYTLVKSNIGFSTFYAQQESAALAKLNEINKYYFGD